MWGAAAAPRACLGYGCGRGAGAGAARRRGGGRGTLIFASRLGCRIKGCRSRGGDLGVRVRAQRLGLVPDGVPPVSAAPEAEIRWLVMPRPISCSAAPTQTPHSVGPRARTAPATAPWSRRMAAARRARTRHPNLKQTPLCRPGSRTASSGYETSSYGPTDGLARTSPAGVGPSWLATRAILRCRAQFATALWTFLPKTCVRSIIL